MADTLTRSYRSFSGVDITAMFGNKRIGTLQGVSFTITREKAPQYVMGRVDPISFSRGKRGIAGSLIFMVFDKANLLEEMTGNGSEERYQFYADQHDIRRDVGGSAAAQRESAIRSADTLRDGIANIKLRDGGVVRSKAWYHDQILPFDIVLTAANEYGQISRMAIHNVEIMNAGSGISIDDITVDENMTFVCTEITPWISINSAVPFQDQELANFMPN